MARGFMILRNIILNLGIKDTQCGFKAFKEKAAKNLFTRLKVFNMNRNIKGSTVTAGFDVELLYIAKNSRLKIKEVPVDWHYQETRHVSPIKDSIEGIADLLKIRLNTYRGIYE
jgi:dolichyl-phosphate beta-glucosyltransferase